jgi:DegV family protein with EDD domain
MLRIVTDGGADMPEGWEEKYQIEVLPLRIRFGDRTYTQGEDIDKNNFYQIVAQNGTIPKTSLPSPGQVLDFYRSISQPGDEILSIHIGDKLSGTFSVVRMAAEEAGDQVKVHTFDSSAGSAILGFMCREARLLDRQGCSIKDILNRLEEIRRRVVVVFTLETLEYARMNGRVNALQSAVSSMLKVKPIIVLRDGLLGMGERVRTRRRSIERVIELVKERIGDREAMMAIVHANDVETANLMVEKVRSVFYLKELVMSELSIPVAANLGPGTIGIAAYATAGGV